MKQIVQKAVPTLLFLLSIVCATAQRVEIVAVEEATKQPLDYYTITGYAKSTHTPLPFIMGRDTLLSYDSILVQAFGYKNQWLKDIKLPKLNVPVITMKVAMIPLNTEVNEVVVSAGKFSEKRKDVARQISIIHQQEIEFASQPNTADLLQSHGNVLVQKSQLGGGSPIMRGFEANKVQLVVDGVRMNNAIYRGGHLQNVLRIDNNLLEKVEIVQGPGSVMYGSDALGGVIHFMTRNPRLAPDTAQTIQTGGAFVRYSSAAQESAGNFNFNLGWKKIAWLGSFTYTQLTDLRQGGIGMDSKRDAWKSNYYATRLNNRDTMLVNTNPLVQKNTGYSQFDIIQKVLFKQNPGISHLLNIQYSSTNDVPRYDRLSLTDSAASAQIPANRFTNESPGNPLRNAEWYYGPEQRLLLAYTRTANEAPRKRISGGTAYKSNRITAAYQDITESRHNRSFGDSFLTSRTENVKVASLNADFQYVSGRNEFRYGAEVIYNKVNSNAKQTNIVTAASLPATTRYPGRGSSMWYNAVYATYNREMAKGWVFNSGLRFNVVTLAADFSDTAITRFPFTSASQANASLNGQAGIVYNSPSGWRFSGLLATGFRAPNVDDLGKVFDSNPKDAIVIVPNPDLKPEYTYNAELSAGKLLGSKGIIEATGWYTLYKQAIVTAPYVFNGSDTVLYDGTPSRVFANQNQNSAYLYGVSLTARYQFPYNITFNASVNYTYGRIVTDSTPYPLDHIPPLYGRAGFTWSNQRFTTEFFTLFNGAKKVGDYNMNGEDNFYDATVDGMPAWYTLNVRGAYRINHYVQAQLSVENFLDKNYRVFASGISAPGINIIATIRVQL